VQVQALSNLGHDYEVRISAMVMHVVWVKYMVLLMEVHQKVLNELIVQASVNIFPVWDHQTILTFNVVKVSFCQYCLNFDHTV